MIKLGLDINSASWLIAMKQNNQADIQKIINDFDYVAFTDIQNLRNAFEWNDRDPYAKFITWIEPFKSKPIQIRISADFAEVDQLQDFNRFYPSDMDQFRLRLRGLIMRLQSEGFTFTLEAGNEPDSNHLKPNPDCEFPEIVQFALWHEHIMYAANGECKVFTGGFTTRAFMDPDWQPMVQEYAKEGVSFSLYTHSTPSPMFPNGYDHPYIDSLLTDPMLTGAQISAYWWSADNPVYQAFKGSPNWIQKFKDDLTRVHAFMLVNQMKGLCLFAIDNVYNLYEPNQGFEQPYQELVDHWHTLENPT